MPLNFVNYDDGKSQSGSHLSTRRSQYSTTDQRLRLVTAAQHNLCRIMRGL